MMCWRIIGSEDFISATCLAFVRSLPLILATLSFFFFFPSFSATPDMTHNLQHSLALLSHFMAVEREEEQKKKRQKKKKNSPGTWKEVSSSSSSSSSTPNE